MKTSTLLAAPLALAVVLSGCGEQAPRESPSIASSAQSAVESSEEEAASKQPFSLTRDDLTITQTISDDADESHAIIADGSSDSYADLEVLKTGNADGDEADFYGTNAAVFASNGGALDLSGIYVNTSGSHANAVFSYGEGSTINITRSVIETSDNCSGGIMVTGGGSLTATDLSVHTSGNSSAAIRSDRGGGTQNVNGGSYVTNGTGSPVIYSTADVTVSEATLESTASQGVVVEGKNSVALNDVDLIASNTSKNSDKSNWYQAVMIYQSMSGDAAEGEASFSMDGGSLTNKNGDIFFVNNTVANINLSNATIVNQDSTGVFLREAAAGWGTEGSNGGHVTLNATKQQVNGDILVDSVSELNLYLKDGSTLTGAVNADNAGSVYVELGEGSSWKLTGDSYVTSLTCSSSSIKLNGHTLYVNGVAYEEGTESSGSAIEFTVSSGGRGGAPDGMPGEPPSGGPGQGGPGAGGEPPAKPGE